MNTEGRKNQWAFCVRFLFGRRRTKSVGIFLWTLICLVSTVVHGQVPLAVNGEELLMTLELFDTDDGLSQGMINGLVEDDQGYLWIATKDGLNRFNGKDFKVFRNDPADSLSIPDNYVYSITKDTNGKIWVVTRNGELRYFSPEKQHFLAIDSSEITEVLILKKLGMVSALPSRSLLLGTEKNDPLSLLREDDLGASDQDIGYTLESISILNPAFGQLVRKDKIFRMDHFDKYGNLWHFEKDALIMYHPSDDWTSGELLKFTDPYYDNYSDYPPFLLDHEKEEVYWAKSEDLGLLLKYDREKKDFLPFLRLPQGVDFNKSAFIDSRKVLWNWMFDGNLLCVNLDSGSYHIIQTQWEGKLEQVGHLGHWLEDSNGNLWCGTLGFGLFKISATARRFKNTAQQIPNPDYPIIIKRFHKPGNAAAFDPSLIAAWRKHRSAITTALEADDYGLNLQQLTADVEGNILFSVSQRNAWKYSFLQLDTASGKYRELLEIPCAENSWDEYDIIPDLAGNVWIAAKTETGINHLYKFTAEDQKLSIYDVPIQVPSIEYRFVSDWWINERNKMLWLATTNGLMAFDMQAETWTVFLADHNSAGSLSHNLLLSICPDPIDPDEFLWVGTEGGGLNKLTISSGEFTHYTTHTGLPNDVVNGIMADSQKTLWLSTNNGLCHFDPQTEEIWSYNQKDGLAGNEYNRYEYCHSANGELYFGGVHGWTHFNPDHFYAEERESTLLIDALRLMNRPIEFNSNSTILTSPLEITDELIFDHTEKMITFCFTLLDLTSPGKNKFSYKLDGFSEKWIDAGDLAEATFTGLGPGEYCLHVIGRNSRGVWNQDPTSLRFTVLTPWWATWWFRLLVISLVLALLYAFYRYRLEQLLRMERMRNRIAQDLHDEIGSAISSISLFGSVLKNTIGKNPEKADQIIERITTYSSRIGERMNDMVWTIKPDNDSFEHVVNRMRAFAVDLAESKGIGLKFEVDSTIETLMLSMDIRKHVYLIFKESVNNAIKYAQCTELSVRVKLEGNQFVLHIKDNGIGFDLGEVEAARPSFGGNGLKGMRRRAQSLNGKLHIETWPNKGTELTLIFEL